MQGDENVCSQAIESEENEMELCRIQGEFEAVELAELAAGRVRRSTDGIRKIMIQALGRVSNVPANRQRFTMLPANMRMENYATAVMISEISDDVLPEPNLRRTARLQVICDVRSAERVYSLLLAAGAGNLRNYAHSHNSGECDKIRT